MINTLVLSIYTGMAARRRSPPGPGSGQRYSMASYGKASWGLLLLLRPVAPLGQVVLHLCLIPEPFDRDPSSPLDLPTKLFCAISDKCTVRTGAPK